MSHNESISQAAVLEQFEEPGCAIGHRPQLAPREPTAEQASNQEVMRLRVAIRRPGLDISDRSPPVCAHQPSWQLSGNI